MAKEEYQPEQGKGAQETNLEGEQAALAEKEGAHKLLQELSSTAPETEDPYEADEWYRNTLEKIKDQFPGVEISLRQSMEEAIAEEDAYQENRSNPRDFSEAIWSNVVLRTPREQGIFDRHADLLEKEGQYHEYVKANGFSFEAQYAGASENGGYILSIIPFTEETHNAIRKAWSGKPGFAGYGEFELGFHRKEAKDAFDAAVRAASENPDPEFIEQEILKVIEKIKPDEE
jgi:hypothetical protein